MLRSNDPISRVTIIWVYFSLSLFLNTTISYSFCFSSWLSWLYGVRGDLPNSCYTCFTEAMTKTHVTVFFLHRVIESEAIKTVVLACVKHKRETRNTNALYMNNSKVEFPIVKKINIMVLILRWRLEPSNYLTTDCAFILHTTVVMLLKHSSP